MSTKKVGDIFSNGGCVGLSFGFESGSQKILDAIQKGVNLTLVPSLLADLSANNIHVQLMGFFGSPGETVLDAEETLSFLRNHSEKYTLLGMGNFVLTPGAILNTEHTRFEIEPIPDHNRTISRRLKWKDKSGYVRSGEENRSFARTANDQFGATRLSRPFVGGIDTAHTLLYFRRYPTRDQFIHETSAPEKPMLSIIEFESVFSGLHLSSGTEIKELGETLNDRLTKADHQRAVKKVGVVKYILSHNGNFYQKVCSPACSWIEPLLA